MFLASQSDVLGVDARRRHRRGGGHQEVHLLEYPGVFLLDDTLHLQCFGVIPPEDELPGQGAVKGVRPVVLSLRCDIRFVGYHAVGHAGEPQGPGILHAGQADFPGFYPQFLQGLDGQTDRRFHFAIHQIEEVIGGDAHLHSLEIPRQGGRIVGHWNRHGAGVQGVVTG